MFLDQALLETPIAKGTPFARTKPYLLNPPIYQPPLRALGFAAASFEVDDRPIYEDFLGGLGA